MPQIQTCFSQIRNINNTSYEVRKSKNDKQNKNNSFSTAQKTMIGATAVAAIVIGSLLLHKHLSKNSIKSGMDVVKPEHKPEAKSKKHRKKNESNKVKTSSKNKMVFENNAQAEKKVQEAISKSLKVQGGRQVKEGQQNIIFNNIDKSNIVRGEPNLEGVTEKMITPQEHSAYARRIRYKRPSIKEQNIISTLHEENAQQRAELNTLGNSKDGNVLAQLLEKLSK